jgi:lysophospholipase L1-like esterase
MSRFRTGLIIVLYCVAIFFALDFIYSNFIYQKKPSARIRSDLYDHTLAANFDGFDVWGPIRYRLITNSLGMKDGAIRDVPLAGKMRRILLIGDSFAEGIGMPFDQSFAGLLYSAGLAASPKIEFLNAGVSSYSPVIYYQKIRALLAAGLRFDEVVVFSDLSDVQDEASTYFCIDDDPQYRARCRLANNKTTRQVGKTLADNFVITDRLRRIIKRKIRRQRGRRPADNSPVKGLHPRVDWTLPDRANARRYAPLGIEGGIKRSIQNMQKLADLLAQHHIPLTIVVYPWPTQLTFNDRDSRQVKIWRDFCAKNCKAFIDLFPAFFAIKDADKDWYKRLFIPGDYHFSADGNAVFYREVAKQLIGPQASQR